jgi:GNAT superfamily N-acetyltransferase
MTEINIRELEKDDVDAVATMEVAAWHEYYSQYKNLYNTIKTSVSIENITKDWHDFLDQSAQYDGKMVTGEERKAYIAVLDGAPIGIGAVTSFKDGVEAWQPVYDLIRRDDGTLPKLAKYQNLYVHPDHRGHAVGHYLNLARADYMLGRGYTGIYLAPYAAATKTMAFHEKNGLVKIHEYDSLSVFENGKRARIACMINLDLQAMRDHWQNQLSRKLEQGKAYICKNYC